MEAPQTERLTCVRCGTEVVPGRRFCPNCRAPLPLRELEPPPGFDSPVRRRLRRVIRLALGPYRLIAAGVLLASLVALVGGIVLLVLQGESFEQTIRRTIREYDLREEIAWRELSLEPIRDYSTHRWLEKKRADFEAMRRQGQHMEVRLLDIDVKEIKRTSADTVEVRSTEIWSIRLIQDGEVVSDQPRQVLPQTVYLRRVLGRWLIDDTEFHATEDTEQAEGGPARAHSAPAIAGG